jgi:glutamyl-tRNA synthetase
VKRGRYAPSPSGRLHIGNAFTALIAWLHMRKAGGVFVLRIEDIDRDRCKPEYEAALLDDLRWLGLDWDEGPDVGGPHGPYRQSERIPLYEEAIGRLLEDGRLYPCTCTRSQLKAIASAPHGLAGEGPAYPGFCRGRRLTPALMQSRYALRFRLPDEPLSFVDGVFGGQSFPPGAGGDFIVKRSDGLFGYQLAVAVDDAAMGITDVLRGEDLLDSTPRQIFLLRALGLPVPRYAHVPLILGEDGRRLAKRHGAVTLCELREAGVDARKLAGCLAHWAGIADRPEPASPRELIPLFNLSSLKKTPVVFDEEKRRQLFSR